jgi:hypothetical protein
MELDVMTFDEVAWRYNVTTRIVRRWVNLRRFPLPLKISGTARFLRDQVSAFEASHGAKNIAP